jgi:hypothetical protein
VCRSDRQIESGNFRAFVVVLADLEFLPSKPNDRPDRPNGPVAVNHRAILTRECESSTPENAGCGRNPDGCARCPDSRFPEQRIGPPPGTALTP